ETLILLDNALFLNEDIVFALKDEEAQPIDFDDEEVISNITKKKILIKAPLDTTVLLDPHYKDLDFLYDDSEKQLIIQRLRNEFSELKEQASELSTCPTLSNTESAT
ncbi:8905_t:CDS:2, partial [Cetraspora pellucida]